jgi:hypothetical protein
MQPVAPIERWYVAPAQLAHGGRQASARGWRHQQMHVVRHQDIRMKRHLMLRQHIPQKCQVVMKIVIINERCCPVDATMSEMERNTRQFQARAAGHGGKLDERGRHPAAT